MAASSDALHRAPEHHLVELRREGTTMALYVAVCLLGYLATLGASHDESNLLRSIWGITLGLALAHWFAYRVATRMALGGVVRRADVELAGAQLVGALGVAVLATVPALLLSEEHEGEGVAVVLAGLVAAAGYSAVRSAGGSRTRAIAYAGLVLLVGAVVVALKNWLSGH